MRNLIKADLIRALKSKILYVGLILVLYRTIDQIVTGAMGVDAGAKGFIDGLHKALSDTPFGALFVVIPIFVAVFSNELSSKSMQCILGHGLTRDKLIASKFLDGAILLACYFIFIGGLIKSLDDGSIALSDFQRRCIVIYILFTMLRYYGYIVFSAMIMFLTDSSAEGIVACVAFTAIFKVTFTVMSLFTEFTIYDYTFDGLLDLSYKLVEIGRFGWQIIPAVIYVAAAVIVTVISLRRKEFEF